jgi:hypothetical protein
VEGGISPVIHHPEPSQAPVALAPVAIASEGSESAPIPQASKKKSKALQVKKQTTSDDPRYVTIGTKPTFGAPDHEARRLAERERQKERQRYDQQRRRIDNETGADKETLMEVLHDINMGRQAIEPEPTLAEVKEPWRPLPKHLEHNAGLDFDFGKAVETAQDMYPVNHDQAVPGGGLVGGAAAPAGAPKDQLLTVLQQYFSSLPVNAPQPMGNVPQPEYTRRIDAMRQIPLMITYNGRLLATYFRMNPNARPPTVYKDINVARYSWPKVLTANLTGKTTDDLAAITKDITKDSTPMKRSNRRARRGLPPTVRTAEAIVSIPGVDEEMPVSEDQ